MQIRRMADASLALAERRPEDLRKATERLGVEGPTNRQLWGLRIMGVVAPPSSAGILARLRGILIVLVALAAVLFAGFGIVSGIALAAGGLSLDLRIFWGVVLVVVVFVVLIVLGRRRQKRAQAERSERLARAHALSAPVCGRYSLAAPDPLAGPRAVPGRRVGRDPPPLQRRARPTRCWR